LGGLAGFPYPPAGTPVVAVAPVTASDSWLVPVHDRVRRGIQRRRGMAAAASLILVPLAKSALIVLDAMINGWFGTFYNRVQQAPGKPAATPRSRAGYGSSLFGRVVNAM
jgi:hypothetical protein